MGGFGAVAAEGEGLDLGEENCVFGAGCCGCEGGGGEEWEEGGLDAHFESVFRCLL